MREKQRVAELISLVKKKNEDKIISIVLRACRAPSIIWYSEAVLYGCLLSLLWIPDCPKRNCQPKGYISLGV